MYLLTVKNKQQKDFVFIYGSLRDLLLYLAVVKVVSLFSKIISLHNMVETKYLYATLNVKM